MTVSLVTPHQEFARLLAVLQHRGLVGPKSAVSLLKAILQTYPLVKQTIDRSQLIKASQAVQPFQSSSITFADQNERARELVANASPNDSQATVASVEADPFSETVPIEQPVVKELGPSNHPEDTGNGSTPQPHEGATRQQAHSKRKTPRNRDSYKEDDSDLTEIEDSGKNARQSTPEGQRESQIQPVSVVASSRKPVKTYGSTKAKDGRKPAGQDSSAQRDDRQDDEGSRGALASAEESSGSEYGRTRAGKQPKAKQQRKHSEPLPPKPPKTGDRPRKSASSRPEDTRRKSEPVPLPSGPAKQQALNGASKVAKMQRKGALPQNVDPVHPAQETKALDNGVQTKPSRKRASLSREAKEAPGRDKTNVVEIQDTSATSDESDSRRQTSNSSRRNLDQRRSTATASHGAVTRPESQASRADASTAHQAQLQVKIPKVTIQQATQESLRPTSRDLDPEASNRLQNGKAETLSQLFSRKTQQKTEAPRQVMIDPPSVEDLYDENGHSDNLKAYDGGEDQQVLDSQDGGPVFGGFPSDLLASDAPISDAPSVANDIDIPPAAVAAMRKVIAAPRKSGPVNAPHHSTMSANDFSAQHAKPQLNASRRSNGKGIS